MLSCLFLFSVVNYCLGQSINSPALDWIQTDESGAYKFGYATGDEGRHYHVQSATADNTVAGKFGYKDPTTGRDLQTRYTAGRRGFRARGPHIARRMDLSQIKSPFSRPDDDGQYHAELDNFFDPTEDRGYDFSYRTSNQIKKEHANRVGDVQGRYSYLDDTGFRHDVNYIAGSKTGFVVSNPVPDTFARARGGALYYVGKTGGAKVRGYTAVQKNLNGAYRFVASGPDHKKSEISDALNNRRGIYTYLDDKGVQHTVEYIAGPKIGYKVIKNKKGVNYNPVFPFFPDTSTAFPFFPSSSSDFNLDSGDFDSFPKTTSTVPKSTPEAFPTMPSLDGAFPTSSETSNAFSPFSNSDDDTFPPLSSVDGSFPTRPSLGSGGGSDGSRGDGGGGGGGGESHPSASPVKPTGSKKPSSPSLFTSSTPSSLFKPSSEKPSSSLDTSNNFDWSKEFPSPSSSSPSSSSASSSLKPQGQSDFGSSLPYDFDYFLKDPANANKDWSKKGQSVKPSTTKKPRPIDPFPDFFPSPFPDIGFEFSDPFREGLKTAESGVGLKKPAGSNATDEKSPAKDDGKSTKDGSNSGSTNRDNKPEGNRDASPTSGTTSGTTEASQSSAKDRHKDHKAFSHSSRGTVKFWGFKKNDWHHFKHGDEYFSIPPGVAVRAHVQSLDIVPWNKKFPSEVLEHHEKEEKKHGGY